MSDLSSSLEDTVGVSRQSQQLFFFFKQKTAYELRISDWSSDVCSSDLAPVAQTGTLGVRRDHALDRAHAQPAATSLPLQADEHREIGRASCRERVCQYV